MLCKLVKVKSCHLYATLEAACRKVPPLEDEFLNDQRRLGVTIIGDRERIERRKTQETYKGKRKIYSI